MPHTRKWYREEHLFPGIIDRDTYDYWVSLGKKSMPERAADKVKELLQKPPSAQIDDHLQAELRKIMLADARPNEVMELPEIQL